jgi:hypothetical protein
MRSPRVVFLLFAIVFACAKKEAAPPAAASDAAPPQTATVASSSVAAPAPVTPATATTAAATSTAAAAPAAATVGAIATADGDQPGASVAIKELKRGSGGMISLKFTIINNTNHNLGFGPNYADSAHDSADYNSVGGVQLIDPVGKKKYFVARDAEGACVCSRGLPAVPEGGTINAWAKFPGAPDDVQKISVVIPHFAPMDDVPISK